MNKRLSSDKVPPGPLEKKWAYYKANCKLVSPGNRKKYHIIVVGTGLAGASAAASLGEMGFKVSCFTFHDSARRAHSVAAQGGVNAAKNYKNDGDSVYRMFFDTIKGGDFRAREANVYRLAECSMSLIDQAVAQGVPFARDYGGYLDNRSFGGVQVSRTFYARGQTGQQLLLGSYQALMRQVSKGSTTVYTRHEMLDIITIDDEAHGIIARHLDTGELETHYADAVIIASGGYGKIYYLSTLAMACNASAVWRAYKKGAMMGAPSWIQFHPTSLPQTGTHQSKLTLMSESLRNDGRIWVPSQKNDERQPQDIPESDRNYYLERRYPSYGNLAPRDISSRAARHEIEGGYGVGPMKNAVYLDFKDAIQNKGMAYIKDRYGNLFDMYNKITGRNPYKEPMMISPSAHFTMGGLWVDYELMTNVRGLFAIGEANFSDHGANRLGANSLLQACVDGYFIIPYTLPNYLAGKSNTHRKQEIEKAGEACKQAIQDEIRRLTQIEGSKTADQFHRELGQILYKYCGLSRTAEGLKEGILAIKALRAEFDQSLIIPKNIHSINTELEKAMRVKDYLELAELMCLDAMNRHESCGAHFREEYQTEEGEALRQDEAFSYVPVWCMDDSGDHHLLKETLNYEFVSMTERSYK